MFKLKDMALILYTVDLAPIQLQVKDWTVYMLFQELHIQVDRIQAMTRQFFLITVGSRYERDEIQETTYTYIFL